MERHVGIQVGRCGGVLYVSCRGVGTISRKECGKGCRTSFLKGGVAIDVEMVMVWQDEKGDSEKGFGKQI